MSYKANSMKTKHYILAIFAALALASCYNDDKLWDAVNEQKQRIEALESWQKVANNNIEAMQILVSGKHYITEITPVTLEGKTVGYTIAFNDRTPITIYNGEKGEKGEQGDKGEQGEQGEQGVAGSTPVISITQQTDGNWYWTLNGELMKDANGKSIRANGEDGKDGQNAPIPVLKTGEALDLTGISGTWKADAIYLSVDNGTTWTQVSGRNGVDGANGVDGTNGMDGDSFFSDVDITEEDYVAFILSGGIRVKVPRYKALALSFNIPAGGTKTTINPARDILMVSDDLVITYEVSGYGIVEDDVRVSAFLPPVATENWTVSVDRDEKSVTIHTKHDNLGIIPLLITTTDNAGHSCTYELTLQTPYEGKGVEANPYKISSADGLAYLSKQVNGGRDYEGKHFQLTENINLEGRKWEPIGTPQHPFKGSFDGGGHSISNLDVDLTLDLNVDLEATPFGGLFGMVTEGEIRNITLLSPKVKATQMCGALIGRCNNMQLIENCNAEDITCQADSMVGGLVGYCENLKEMKNCHVKDATLKGINHVGGLIATYDSGDETTISKCSATQCTIDASGSWGHGGLIATHLAGKLTLEGCYTTGTIKSGSIHEGDVVAGALLGQGRGNNINKDEVNMKGCYSTMSIVSDTPAEEHSLRGKAMKFAKHYTWTFSNCYYITLHTGQTPTKGITYQSAINGEMIQKMNTELGDIYNTDGTFK